MIRKLLTTTALAGIIATAAYAQEATTGQPNTQPATPDAATTSTMDSQQEMPAGGEMSGDSASAAASGNYLQSLSTDQYLASNINGQSLYPSDAPDAEAVGEIQNFLLDQDGRIAAAVVDATINDESKTVAIPFDQITFSMGEGNEPRAVLSGGAESLASAPAFTTPEEQQAAQAGAGAAGGVAGTTGGAADMAAGGAATGSSPGMASEDVAAGSAADLEASGAPTGAEGSDMAAGGSAAGAATTASGEYPTSVGPNQMLSQNLMGSEVYTGPGEDAESVGSINDIVMNSSGDIEALVVGVGGFLGIGEKDVAVPFDRFEMASSGGQAAAGAGQEEPRVILAANRDQLEQAPSFEDERPQDQAAAGGGSMTGEMAAAGAAAGGAAAGGIAAAENATGDAMESAGTTMENAATEAEEVVTGDDAAETSMDSDATATTTTTTESDTSSSAATGAAVGATAGAAAGTEPSMGTPASDQASTGGATSGEQLQPVTDQAQLTADNLIGTAVYGPNNEEVGDIGDIALNPEGQVDAVIVDVGGFLGIGEKPVAVAMDNLQFMQDSGGDLVLNTQFTQQQLEEAPEYSEEAYAQNRDQVVIENPSDISSGQPAGVVGDAPANSTN